MIETCGVSIERIACRLGPEALENGGGDPKASAAVAATGFKTRRVVPQGMSLFDFAFPCAKAAAGDDIVKGVVVATFSHEELFPSLAVRIASALSLPVSTPAFDIQMACSAYPYALYVAAMLSRDLGGKVLVVDADIQSRYLKPGDMATSLVMDDAASASIVRATEGKTNFDFLSSFDSSSLSCPAGGPIAMDGFKVFSFVAGTVKNFLAPFGGDFDFFVPHRANLYMVRRLAKGLGLEDKLLAPDLGFANPGSASIPVTLALAGKKGRALLAGFGAGLSASAAIVELPDGFRGEEIM